MRIEVIKHYYIIYPENITSYNASLLEEERLVHDALFKNKNTLITLEKSYHNRITAAKRVLLKTVESDAKSAQYLGKKWPFILLGVLASVAFFEQLLPYAIAFRLENQWAERFKKLLDTLPVTTQTMDPVFYHHSNLSNSMSSTIKAASFSPHTRSPSSSSSSSGSSWSSGSSGGGSSGGGGGGDW